VETWPSVKPTDIMLAWYGNYYVGNGDVPLVAFEPIFLGCKILGFRTWNLSHEIEQ
jgi:hypothetical protein